jgi:very-short-patch-repair endonuclease
MRARKDPADHEVAALAYRQHGVVAHCQLVELGFGEKAIQYRLAVGRLHQVHVRVYAVGHPKLTQRGRWKAAVLACGPGALLSHWDAAALWGLRPTSRRVRHVTAMRSRHSREGIVVHRVRRLHEDDGAVEHGIPLTAVPRTLLDLAELVPMSGLERAWEQAERLRLLDVRAVERLLARSNGRHGRRALGELVDQALEPPPTRSDFERDFLDLCRRANIPRPAVNAMVDGYEVDMLWNEQKLIVELDSWRDHGTRAGFEQDRERDAVLQLAGYRIPRITYRRLRREPDAVAGTVLSLLG